MPSQRKAISKTLFRSDTMKPSIKQCTICNKPRPYWSAKFKLCKECFYRMPENKKPIEKKVYTIPKESAKRSKENRLYHAKRILYLTTHKECEAVLPGCLHMASDIHHLYFGSDRNLHLTDETTWKAVCRECHRIIHDEMSNDELLKLGLRRK